MRKQAPLCLCQSPETGLFFQKGWLLSTSEAMGLVRLVTVAAVQDCALWRLKTWVRWPNLGLFAAHSLHNNMLLRGMLLVLKKAGLFPNLSQVTSHNEVMAKNILKK